jgi:aminopeptidase YwaD
MKRFVCMMLMVVLVAGQSILARQTVDFSRSAVIERLRQDLEYLASDEMEGREAGTQGELKAAHFIKQRMQEIGLQPVFGSSYFQEFDFSGSWEWDGDNLLTIGSIGFEHGDDFFTLPGSANATVSAAVVDVGNGLHGVAGYNDYAGITDIEGKILLMEYYLSPDIESASGLTSREQIEVKLAAAEEKGAAAVLFRNSHSSISDPRVNLRVRSDDLNIPVIFVKGKVVSALEANEGELVTLTTSISRPVLQSLNVAGYIDNKAETTVVIGGHYDHLGYGGRSSRSPEERMIHYGADDNASGTAGVLEAALYFSNSTLTSNNYLFIAFGAEEKGLVGSRHFTTSDDYDMKRVNYMFNLDMIGRLTDNRLTLIGTGSSPTWDSLIDRLAPDHLQIRKSPGGLGGSDHAPFYMREIPVIFFFTGTHADYHRPSDTPDKINYEGSYQILSLMYSMAGELDEMERLAFSKAPVADNQQRRMEGPTFGLMPDHTFDGEGLRVQAVIENRPAQLAGMQDGDVIIRINDKEVREIQTYMDALGTLQRGIKTDVVVRRGEEEVLIQVQL